MITGYLWAFDYKIAKMPPALLMTTAVVLFILGLFVLFGGFGCRRILFIIIGAFCGAACTISIAGSNYLLAAALAAGGAMLSFKLQETFLTFVIAFLATIYGYSVLISPYFKPTQELIDMMRQLTIGVPYYNWPILLGVILAPFALAASWYAGISAGYPSLTASVMFLAGTIMLSKKLGYEIVAMISSNTAVVLGILAGITITGMVIQILIMPCISNRFAIAKEAARHKAKKSKKAKKQDSESGEAGNAAWRTS